MVDRVKERKTGGEGPWSGRKCHQSLVNPEPKKCQSPKSERNPRQEAAEAGVGVGRKPDVLNLDEVGRETSAESWQNLKVVLEAWLLISLADPLHEHVPLTRDRSLGS